MHGLLRPLFDLVLPPRRTELLLRSVTADYLHELSGGGALPYHDPRITALVWELKYYGSRQARHLAGTYLSELVLGLATEELGTPLLVPVPMHYARRRERGHNQTELLCQTAAAILDKTVVYTPRALVRLVHTPHQQGLPRHIRLKNVANSMQADERQVRGRACIVVDDVTTTGATLEEAKRALLFGGARVVHCIALARS